MALLRLVDRHSLSGAVTAGLVVHDSRGLYHLPGIDEAVRVAARLNGAVSSVSAALARGWAVAVVPDRPHVTVSRGRHLGGRVRDAHVHRAELGPGDVEHGITSAEVTFRDCLRQLPFTEALAVADSALRESGCHELLRRVGETAAGPGAPRIRAVAAAAHGRAADPFESTLRGITLGVPGLDVEPQVTISEDGWTGCPDLVDRGLRLVLEADSFAWHGGREALARDARRYNALVVRGWTVRRFSWEDVMGDPAAVVDTLNRAVALTELLKEVSRGRRAAA